MVYFGNYADLAVRPGGDRSRAAARRLPRVTAGEDRDVAAWVIRWISPPEGCNIAVFAGLDSATPPSLCSAPVTCLRLPLETCSTSARMAQQASLSGRSGRVGDIAAAGDIGGFGDVARQQPPDPPNAETKVSETRSDSLCCLT
jgi:hypothetical protein